MHMTLPIDELQRRAEELEFSELLDQACFCSCLPAHNTCSTEGTALIPPFYRQPRSPKEALNGCS